MRSISIMASDEMAGDAKHRVPLPYWKEEGKCEAFLSWLPTKWQVMQSIACRYHYGRRKENSKCEAFLERRKKGEKKKKH